MLHETNMPALWYVIQALPLFLTIVCFWWLFRFVRNILRAARAKFGDRAGKRIRAKELEWAENITRMRAGPDLYESPMTADIIALNRQRREMTIGTLADPTYVPFEKIVHAEIVTGGATLTQADPRQSNSWVGGDDYTDTLAMRRALTADRMSRNLIVDLSIKVTIDDWSNPVRTVRFLEVSSGGIDPRSDLGSSAIRTVETVYAKLGLIIREFSNPDAVSATSAVARLTDGGN